jgi:hypothetical protein
VSGGHDPFAAIAEPPTQGADPFAAIAEKPAQAAATAPLRDRLSETTKPTGAPNIQDVANVGGGFLAPLLHPLDTAKSLWQMTSAAFTDPTPVPGTRRLPPVSRPDVGAMAQQFHDNPRGTLENMAGQTILAEGVGEIAPRLVPKGDTFQSSPRLVKKLVEDTREANTATEGKNAKALEIHKQQVGATDTENARLAKEHQQATSVVDAENTARRAKHQEDTKAVAGENEANQAKYQAANERIERLKKTAKEKDIHKGRLSRGVQENSARLVNQVQDLQTKAKGKIDAQWDDLRKKVGDAEVPRDQLSDLVRGAESKLSGSSENIKVFRDILSKGTEQSVKLGGAAAGVLDQSHPLYQQLVQSGVIEQARPATFRDLQGYYSELGEKLSSGSLPGDVYQAIKSLQEDIDRIMQRIAAERGQGAALNTARSAYRDYMQTFRDISGPSHSGSPIAESLAAKDPAYAVAPLLREQSGARVRNSLAQYGDDVHGAAAVYDNLRSKMRDLDSIEPVKIPKAPTAPKVAEAPTYPNLKARPELKTVPQPKSPEIAPRKTLSAADVQQAKTASYEKQVEGINRYGHKMSVVLPMLYLAHDLVKLNVPDVPSSVGGAAIGYAGTTAITNLLERPAVVDFFTKATEADLAQIPTDLRGDIPTLVKAAEQKGLTVSPALKQLAIGAVGAIAPRKHPSDVHADGH